MKGKDVRNNRGKNKNRRKESHLGQKEESEEKRESSGHWELRYWCVKLAL
jgi:hypothetical protein